MASVQKLGKAESEYRKITFHKIVLDQDQNGRTLYVRGRDVEEKETAVIFTAGAWSILGEAAAVRRSVTRNVTLDAGTLTAAPRA